MHKTMGSEGHGFSVRQRPGSNPGVTRSWTNNLLFLLWGRHWAGPWGSPGEGNVLWLCLAHNLEGQRLNQPSHMVGKSLTKDDQDQGHGKGSPTHTGVGEGKGGSTSCGGPWVPATPPAGHGWGNPLSSLCSLLRRKDANFWLLLSQVGTWHAASVLSPSVHQWRSFPVEALFIGQYQVDGISVSRERKIHVSRHLLTFSPLSPTSGPCWTLSTKELQRFGKRGKEKSIPSSGWLGSSCLASATSHRLSPNDAFPLKLFLCGTVFLLCCCILIFRLLMGSGILEPLKWQHRDKQSLRWVINKRKNTYLRVWRRRDTGTVTAQILHILTRVNILHRRDDKMQNQPQRSQPTLLRCFLITVFIKKQKRPVPMVSY